MEKAELKKIYRQKFGSKKDSDIKMRNELAEELSINQYAMPNMCDILEVFRHQTDNAPGFSAHFAPVIMTDGYDAITLENYARGVAHPRAQGSTKDASFQWYFRMIGPPNKDGEDQTFFGETRNVANKERKDGTMVVLWRRHQKSQDK